MAVGSILLAIAAFGCAVLGVLTTPIPGLGAVFSFAAPMLALGGSLVGGVAMSRAKREGKDTGVARAGVILSGIAFVPALLTAMFCGVCNALCATGEVHMQRSVSFGVDPNAQKAGSGGARALPPPPFAGSAEPNPPPSAAPNQAPTAAPPVVSPSPPAAPTAPAAPGPGAGPAMPPPPLPAGPKQGG